MPPQPSSPQSTTTPWDRILDLVQELYLQNVAFFLPEARAGFEHRLALANLVASIREYAIKVPDDIDGVWNSLSEMSRCVDILVYTAADLDLRLPNHGTTWEALNEQIAQALLLIRTSQGSATVCDEMFLESFGEKKGLLSILSNNRWLTLLLLLRRSGAFNMRSSREPARDNPPTAD